MKLREPGWAIYGPKTEQLPSKNHSLTVFLQSWKYFIHAENQLRLDLSFRSVVVVAVVVIVVVVIVVVVVVVVVVGEITLSQLRRRFHL